MVVTTKQLTERANYLGGSDAAGILGLSKWKTPLQVFMAKIYPNHDESENRIGGKNEPSYWGNKLEDKVAEAFTEVTGKKVNRVKETLIHPEYDFIRANLDRRVVGEDAILECKTAHFLKNKEWENEEIPTEYILQVMHYLAVTGKAVGYIAVLIGGSKFVWKQIDRDEELIKQIIDAEVNFWNNFVISKVPPMVTGSERDSELLARLYPEANPSTSIQLPENHIELIEKRAALKKLINDTETQITEIENLIKAELKDNETGSIGKYLVTWKNQSRTGVDSKKLKEEYPDIFLNCQKTSNFRVMNFREIKEKKESK